jgi:hypothetical protein
MKHAARGTARATPQMRSKHASGRAGMQTIAEIDLDDAELDLEAILVVGVLFVAVVLLFILVD